jgi:NADH-quinone oxidoreductase subunit F
MVHRIEHGQGRADDLDMLNSIADNIQGRTICALGDAAAMPVRAMIKHFRHEFQELIDKAQAARAASTEAPTPALPQGGKVSTQARSA